MLSISEVDDKIVNIRLKLEQIERDILDIANSQYSISDKDIEYLLDTVRTSKGITNYYIGFGVHHG